MPTLDIGLTRTQQVLGRIPSWQLTAERWRVAEQRLAELLPAVSTADTAAVLHALAALELAGPDRAAPPITDGRPRPVEDGLPDRVNELVHQIGEQVERRRAAALGAAPGASPPGESGSADERA